MSKFLLKIELPDEKSCEGCPCLPDDEWRCLVEGEYISDGSGVPANGFPRPEWCPLEKHDAFAPSSRGALE